MEVNDIEIPIPKGYEIDEEKSTCEKIVFKPKRLITYDDVAIGLFHNSGFYYTTENGEIEHYRFQSSDCLDANKATSEHQLKCILAKNKLANVARYLNGDWKPSLYTLTWYIIFSGTVLDTCNTTFETSFNSSRILFKSEELAQQAIKILGEEEVKLALEPLY